MSYLNELIYFLILDLPPSEHYQRAVIINLSDNDVELLVTKEGNVIMDKSVDAGKRFDVREKEYLQKSKDDVPAPYVYTATDTDGDFKYYINGKESYSVPWHPEPIDYVLYIVKRPGKYGPKCLYCLDSS